METIYLDIALISVLIAGFASIAVVIRDERLRDPTMVRLRLVNLLILSLMTTLFAMAPDLLVAMGADEAGAYQVAQLTFATSCAIVLATRFLPSLRTNRESGGGMGFFILSSGIFCAAILLQMISAIQMSPLSVAGSYAAGITLVLVVAGLLFFRLVTSVSSVRSD